MTDKNLLVMCASMCTGRQKAARRGALECMLLQCGEGEERLRCERGTLYGGRREIGRNGGREGETCVAILREKDGERGN